MKKFIDDLDATPSKRAFLSIIADYDLNRSICELIDNALDVWVRRGRAKPVSVDIILDKRQQTITVTDTAGGLLESELRNVVGLGQTGANLTDQTIGIFGVGTKRAVVALSQDIKITARYGNGKTFQVEFDDNWLKDEDWHLPYFEVDTVNAGTTVVELQKLRIEITDDAVNKLREHIAATYAKFLAAPDVVIKLDGANVAPCFFDDWSYPPKYVPRRYIGTLPTDGGGTVKVEVVAGLSSESSPAAGEYGVYFYCNDRLVARALKTFEVGFEKGVAGLPHPKVSLTKVLVFLSGNVGSMPWNSSKSDISTKHEVFIALHGWLIQVVKEYASLSRIWMGDWPKKVFKYKTGTIVDVPITDFPAAQKSFLPPLPKSRPRYSELITRKNKAVVTRKPWTKGLYEGVIAADLISKQHLDQRNRISLVVLDSTLEIAFKEYLVNDSGVTYNDARLLALFRNRHDVHREIQKYVTLSADIWKKINHYYNLRCELIHKRATAGITDPQLQDYRELVEHVLRKLYGLNFSVT